MNPEQIPSEQLDIDFDTASDRAEELALAEELRKENPGWGLEYALSVARGKLWNKRHEKRVAKKEEEN